ncbi:hypothetical protein ACFE33_09035 [Falsihalocynthiibacter sp. SS001]|uniref:hypothetical protein n=1 Tax=Falsihalocynthiibacter sp. SS001 TaxID=3349698 RepID=UPI0036D3169A
MRRTLAFVLICAATEASSDTPIVDRISRAVELPRHEALFRVLEDANTSLAPFETDGCSGGMSATWEPVASILPRLAETYKASPPWESCCVTHDRAYHNASNAATASESYEARLSADETLRQCVFLDGEARRLTLAEEFAAQPDTINVVYKLIADGMFNAVRLGGAPCSGLSWRWGYGYPSCFWE